jgi:nicotinamide mononucleotide transporter
MQNMSWSEVLGFVAGVVSVWLFVRQSVWAWPTGIANSVFWLILFAGERLFLDAALQTVYVVLGIMGWVWWARGRPGGNGRTELPVRRTPPVEAGALTLVGVVSVAGLWWAMQQVGDSAPLPDAATTVVSLIAQYLLTRKLLATWWCWIAVDVAYVVLYTYKGLYLTAALQPLFIALCVLGLRGWRAALEPSTVDQTVTTKALASEDRQEHHDTRGAPRAVARHRGSR